MAFVKTSTSSELARQTKQWIQAAKDGRISTLASMLDLGFKIDVHDKGWTASMTAASLGQRDCLKFLVEAGCDLEAKSLTGATAAMEAVVRGTGESLKILLAAGCEVDVQGVDGRTAPWWRRHSERRSACCC